MSAPAASARQTHDDAHHEFFCVAHDADRHQGHGHHQVSHLGQLGRCDLEPSHVHQLVHLVVDPAHHDLVRGVHPGHLVRVRVAKPEFFLCVRSSTSNPCAVAGD